MSVTAGEFFVNLGVKGADKTISAITDTTKGMSGLASMSLEAKAAIVGALYALERLMADSADYGAHLTNISVLLGEKGIAKALQQYEWAAQQVGVSTASVDNAFQGLASTLEDIKFGKGPDFASLVLGEVHADPERFRNDIQYAMRKLQEFALSTHYSSQDKLKFLKGFGLDAEFISAMMQNAFRPEVLARAPVYSDQQLKALQHIKAEWANLGTTIERAIGKFNIAHGGELIKDISKLVPKVLELANAFTKLAETLKVFQIIGKVFEGWSYIFQGATAGVQALNDIVKHPEKKGAYEENALEFFKLLPEIWKGIGEDLIRPFTGAQISPAPNQNSTTINQTLQFQHDGRDHKQVQDSHKKAIKDAYNAIPGIVRGS